MPMSSRALAQNLALIMALFMVLTTSSSAHAWGRRGHAIVCETAAYVAAQKPGAEFLKAHSYDLGYYCNVPDLVWKEPATYQAEWYNHFMDMEIFNRKFKGEELKKAFEMDRLTFNKTYPDINNKAGRSFWRIREMMADADKLAEQLKKTDLSVDERHKLQVDWLLHAGAAGHYVGDLVQPLHVTENYDGQMTGQKGVHAYFEDEAVDELFYLGGKELEQEIMAAAMKKWKTIGEKMAKRPMLDVLMDLAEESNSKINELLAIDKKVGRKDIEKASKAYHDMIVDRISTGAVALAGFWGNVTGWPFDGNKFFTFVPAPTFIAPPGESAPAPKAEKAEALPKAAQTKSVELPVAPMSLPNPAAN